ncbi:MAG: ROK family protein [Promethearchaeota archaeon]
MDEKFIVGVDIGGTWIRAGLCTPDLKEENIKTKVTKTLKENEYSVSKSVIQLISELLKENKLNREQILGIGLASAGPLEVEKGLVFNNANLGFKTIPLKQPIGEVYSKCPIFLINDGSASVLGVYFFEADDDEKDNLVYITMSTGIGGGVICNGHLLFGKEGNAAEIGHAIVEPRSIHKCNCGANGCWEVYSSGTGVKGRALEALERSNLDAKILMHLVDNEITKITAKEIFQAARGGDKFSKKIVDNCIFYTMVGIGLINNFYDCSSIYFGGAMMKDHDMILKPIREQFKTNPIQFTINHPPRIKVTKYLNEIGLRGALTFVKYKLEGNKVIP